MVTSPSSSRVKETGGCLCKRCKSKTRGQQTSGRHTSHCTHCKHCNRKLHCAQLIPRPKRSPKHGVDGQVSARNERTISSEVACLRSTISSMWTSIRRQEQAVQQTPSTRGAGPGQASLKRIRQACDQRVLQGRVLQSGQTRRDQRQTGDEGTPVCSTLCEQQYPCGQYSCGSRSDSDSVSQGSVSISAAPDKDGGGHTLTPVVGQSRTPMYVGDGHEYRPWREQILNEACSFEAWHDRRQQAEQYSMQYNQHAKKGPPGSASSSKSAGSARLRIAKTEGRCRSLGECTSPSSAAKVQGVRNNTFVNETQGVTKEQRGGQLSRYIPVPTTKLPYGMQGDVARLRAMFQDYCNDVSQISKTTSSAHPLHTGRSTTAADRPGSTVQSCDTSATPLCQSVVPAWHALPRNVSLLIMSHLDSPTQSVARLVCKKWNVHVNFSARALSCRATKELPRLPLLFPRLTRVRLEVPPRKRVDVSPLADLEHLQCLEIVGVITCSAASSCGISNVGSLSSCRRLSQLHISSSVAFDNTAFLSCLTTYKSLRNLSMPGSTHVSPALFQTLPNLPNLTNLCLSNCQQIDANSLTPLRKLTQLTGLDLSFCRGVTDQACAEIANVTTLQTLDISACSEITDAGFQQLRTLTALHMLRCSLCDKITDRGFVVLRNMKRLVILDISTCSEVTDTTLALIGELCFLKWLDVSHCPKLTDTGFCSISQTGCLSVLQVLDVRGCRNISSRTTAHIVAAKNLTVLNVRLCEQLTCEALMTISQIKSLQALDIGQIQMVTPAVVSYLAASLPRLKALYVHNVDSLEHNSVLRQYIYQQYDVTLTTDGSTGPAEVARICSNLGLISDTAQSTTGYV